MASEKFEGYPKNNSKFLKYVLKPATGGIVFFDFLKQKIKRYSPKNLFYYCLDKKPFCPFLENYPKICFQINLNFFLAIVLCFLGPSDFLKIKTLPRMQRPCANFQELSSYKYTWSAETVTFRKSQRSAKSLHPTVQ